MRSANKILFALVVLLSSCKTIATTEETTALKSSPVAMVSVPSSELKNIPQKGQVFLGEEPFTGYSIKYYENDQPAERITYIKGKKEGLRQKWYRDGILSYEANYTSNRIDGTSKSWWPNGNLRSESNLTRGVISGMQRQWYSSGALFKELRYVDGREEGMQRAWRENGKLYTNYEAKNGRTFGLKRSTLCFELDEEEVQFGC